MQYCTVPIMISYQRGFSLKTTPVRYGTELATCRVLAGIWTNASCVCRVVSSYSFLSLFGKAHVYMERCRVGCRSGMRL